VASQKDFEQCSNPAKGSAKKVGVTEATTISEMNEATEVTTEAVLIKCVG